MEVAAARRCALGWQHLPHWRTLGPTKSRRPSTPQPKNGWWVWALWQPDPLSDADVPSEERHARLPTRHAGKRSEERTSELQSLMRISYAVFCLKKKKAPTKMSK